MTIDTSQTARAPAADEIDDLRLVEAAQRRPAAFALLYDRYLPRVYRYLLHRVGAPEDAEDLTAQVFFDALRSIGRYRPTAPFAAWLFAIARRRLADHHRRPNREVPLDLDWGSEANALLDEVMWTEDLARLAAEVTALDDAEHELIELRFSAGLSYLEMAALLGSTEGAVKKSVYRLLERLAARMEVSHE